MKKVVKNPADFGISVQPNMLYAYSVKDKLTGLFGCPFFDVNDACAVRRVINVYKNNPVAIDLELYCVGVFNADKGDMSGEFAAVKIVNIGDYYEAQKQE